MLPFNVDCPNWSQKVNMCNRITVGSPSLAKRNLLTLKLLRFFADLSAGLAGSAAAIGGQEERGDCET